uniref:Protein YjdM C-terminal domain-containing protein n=1 Tax=Proboscia inermis TaxID=420281 RepID=A0A7S0CHX1_9STRA|mmetsp:Transcript_49230/g.49575  ORF Transcript_49230/g.49575 Transcript_49230/m.49575 type:complete len:184 (+) Transcript_49230:31-582(+)
MPLWRNTHRSMRQLRLWSGSVLCFAFACKIEQTRSFLTPKICSPPKRIRQERQITTTQTRLSYSTIPEPGACPGCGDETTYWDGSTLFVCTACANEWAVDSVAQNKDAVSSTDDDEVLIRDVNGNILETGDGCVLVQDLAKGKLKKGLKVKIRLGDYGDGHDCEASISGVGTYALKSKFLKKV